MTDKERDAFAELMSKKPKDVSQPRFRNQAPRPTGFNRDVLAQYINHPEDFPSDQVVSYNDKFVVINDAYPKASLHCLVLSRDNSRNTIHPFESLDDPGYRAEVLEEAARVKQMLADELRRRHGRVSVTDKPRIEAMQAETLPAQLPAGRDWSKEIMCGFHAQPSMNHLHVHVLSRDMVSPSLKKRTHYEAFNTAYFVTLDKFPLSPDDPLRDPESEFYANVFGNDMICWRCGRNFSNKFTRFKEHLQSEFEDWRRE